MTPRATRSLRRALTQPGQRHRRSLRAVRGLSRVIAALMVTLGLLAGSAALSSGHALAASEAPAVSAQAATAASAAQPAGWQAKTAAKTAKAARAESVGNRILDKAETKVNHYYSWAGVGPSSFDCSGLVYWSAGAAGIRNWPRDTYSIAAEIGKRFVYTSHPVRGDLAMWGSARAPYHVEIVTAWRHTNFGAETYGWKGRVTWHKDTWFHPSFYLHPRY